MVRVGPLVSIWAAGLSVALRNQRLHSCRTGGGTLISTVGGLWDPFPQPWLCTEKALKTSEEAPGQKQTIGLEAARDPGAVHQAGAEVPKAKEPLWALESRGTASQGERRQGLDPLFSAQATLSTGHNRGQHLPPWR